MADTDKPTPEQLSRASYHMAGHYIVANHFGFQLTQPEPGYCCRLKDDSLPNDKEYEWVITLMAGRAGRKLAPDHDHRHKSSGHQWKTTLDEFEAADLLEMLGYRATSVRNEQVQLAESQAREILLQQSETLDCLASALIEAGSLTLDEARAIIEANPTKQGAS